ncbi:MAG: hypothetical protein U1A77_21915 [Pirellulales bacterium]
MSQIEEASPAPIVTSNSSPTKNSRFVFWIVLIVLLCVLGPPIMLGILGLTWYKTASSNAERAFQERVEAERQAVEVARQRQEARMQEFIVPVPGGTPNTVPRGMMGSGMGMGAAAPSSMSGSGGMGLGAMAEGGAPVESPSDNMVRLELQFGKFGVATVDALVVDNMTSHGMLYVAPAGPMQPRRGKVNGREVVVPPELILRDSRLGGAPGGFGGMGGGMPSRMDMQGMPGMGPGMSASGIAILSAGQTPRESPGTGLCVFSGSGLTPPIQLLGDLPEATVGELVAIASAEGKIDLRSATVTAVGVDLDAQPGSPLVKQSIQVTAADAKAIIPLGSLLLNARNQPLGMVVRVDKPTQATNEKPTSNSVMIHATPIAKVFSAASDWKPSVPTQYPEAERAGPPPVLTGSTPTASDSREEEDVEWRQLDDQASLLAELAKKASGDERMRLREQLIAAVTRQFDRRQQLRQTRIEELEQRLGKLRDEHQTREQAKTEEVNKRVDTLVPPMPEKP